MTVKIKKSGFTLAEVLITLAIVGVVAAITIPTIIKNYQKMVWTMQLKKSYATLNQGFQRMLADEGVSLLSQTQVFQSIGGTEREDTVFHTKYYSCNSSDDINSDNCKNFYDKLNKYFKISDVKRYSNSDRYRYKYLNHPDTTGIPYLTGNIITFTDGTKIIASFSQTDTIGGSFITSIMKGSVGSLTIDLNGIKGPNQYGRDLFKFSIGDNGFIYPTGSIAVSERSDFAHNIKNPIYYWKTTSDKRFNCKTDVESQGFGCAARVLETGKMDY